MKQAITCKFTCRACGLHRVSVTVPAREDEEVTEWMEKTAALVGRNHTERSPRCLSTTMDEFMIPIEGADKIGGPIKPNVN